MYCPECGCDAGHGNYCPQCGHDLTSLVDHSRTPDPGECNECGAEVGEARFCPECGEERVSARTPRNRARRSTGAYGPAKPRPATPSAGKSRQRQRAGVREQKRSQFASPRSRRKLLYAYGMIGVVVVAAAMGVVLMMRGGTGSAATTQTVAAGGNVKIPTADLADGTAEYYTYDSGGVSVKYLAVKGPDGKYRTALDACKVCYGSKKGYRQEGTDLVCNNCGTKVAITTISVLKGDCNPFPVTNKLKGSNLVLKSEALDAGAQYFQ